MLLLMLLLLAALVAAAAAAAAAAPVDAPADISLLQDELVATVEDAMERSERLTSDLCIKLVHKGPPPSRVCVYVWIPEVIPCCSSCSKSRWMRTGSTKKSLTKRRRRWPPLGASRCSTAACYYLSTAACCCLLNGSLCLLNGCFAVAQRLTR